MAAAVAVGSVVAAGMAGIGASPAAAGDPPPPDPATITPSQVNKVGSSSGTVGGRTVNVAWSFPGVPAGLPTGYQSIEVQQTTTPGDSGSWVTVTCSTGMDFSMTPVCMTGQNLLSVGQTYYYRGRYTTSDGTSDWSSSASVTIAQPFLPITGVAIAADRGYVNGAMHPVGQLQVNWNVPSTTTTADIKSFQVKAYKQSDDSMTDITQACGEYQAGMPYDTWNTSNSAPGTAQCTYNSAFSLLTLGVDYYFKVAPIYATANQPSEMPDGVPYTGDLVGPTDAMAPITWPISPPTPTLTSGPGNGVITASWTPGSEVTASAPVDFYAVVLTESPNSTPIAGGSQLVGTCGPSVTNTGGTLSCTVTGYNTGGPPTNLDPAKQYQVQILAFNPVNDQEGGSPDSSQWTSSLSNAVLPGVGPNAPTIGTPTIGSGSGKINVNWTAPTSGPTPDSYKVYAQTDGTGSYDLITTGACGTSPTGLTCVFGGVPGHSYKFYVTAVASGVESDPSGNSSSITAIEEPAQPSGTPVATVNGDGSVSVAWTDNTADSARPTDSYFVEYRVVGDSSWTAAGSCAAALGTPCTVGSLTPGTQYQFRVTAHNTVGNSLPSAISSSVTALTLPDTADDVTAVVSGPTEMTVTWTPPASTTAAPVNSVVMKIRKDGGAWEDIPAGSNCAPLSGSDTTCSISGLDAGSDYEFKIVSGNEAGTAESDSSGSVTAIDVPDDPMIDTTVVQGDKSLTVSWTATAGTTGQPVSGYRLLAQVGGTGPYTVVTGGTCADPMSNSTATCSLTGLTAGDNYTFKIEAINDVGIADSSATNSATVVAGPNAPTIDTAAVAAGSGKIDLAWSPDSSGPTPDHYAVYRATSVGGPYTEITSGGCSSPMTAALCTDDTASPGTTYYYTVSGITSGVEGAQSDPTTGIEALQPPALPDQPTVAVSAPGAVQVTWTDPTPAAGADPSGYTVEVNIDSGGWVAVPAGTCLTAPASPCVISGVTAGSSVQVRVTANNAAGSSSPSTPSSAATVINAPAAPTSFIAAPSGDGTVKLTWTPPTSSSSAPVDSVSVQIWNGTAWDPVPSGSGTCYSAPAPDCSVSGLTPGVNYQFRAVSHNDAGSTGSNGGWVTAVSPPDEATDVSAAVASSTAGDGSMTVTFTAPTSSIEKPVDLLAVQISTNGTDWTTPTGGSCVIETSTGCTISGLTPGETYQVRVVATNGAGSTNSTPSSGVEALQPPVAPDQPTVTVDAPGSVSVTWTDPPAAAGADPSSWVVEIQVDGSSWQPAPAGSECATTPTSPCSIDGLTPGSSVKTRVRAVNEAGTSVDSNESDPTTVIGAPAAATSVAAEVSAGTGVAEVTWTAPDSTTAAPVDSVKVQYRDTTVGGSWTDVTTGSCTTAASGCTVEGLTPGHTYEFQVVSHNSAADTPSTAASLEALEPPASPNQPTAIPKGSGGVQVTWTDPTPADGADATEWELVVTKDGVQIAVPAGACSPIATPCQITGLDVGSTYTFAVVAKNAAGSSADSPASSGVAPVNAPDAPTNVAMAVTPGTDSSLTVTWTPPSGTVDSYNVYVSDNPNGPFTTLATCSEGSPLSSSPCTIATGLNAGTTYYTQVAAVHSGVEGTNSTTASATAIDAPAQPGAPAATLTGPLQMTLQWTENSTASAPVTGYVVEMKDPNDPTNWIPVPGGTCLTAPAPGCTITGLTDGVDYSFHVVASNAAGNGQTSNESSSVTAYDSPAAPTGVTVTSPSSGEADLSWTAPAGGADGGYNVYRAQSPNGPWVLVTDGGCASPVSGTSCSQTGMSDGQYYYKVEAIDHGLTGPAADPVSTMVYTPVGTPVITSVVPGDGQATVNVAPGPGGVPASYTVTASNGKTCTVTPPQTSCTITGLSNGVAYTFTVVASNPLGDSTESSASEPVKPTPSGGGAVQAKFTSIVLKANSMVVHWAPTKGASPTAYQYRSQQINKVTGKLGAWSKWTTKGVTPGQLQATLKLPRSADGFWVQLRTLTGNTKSAAAQTMLRRTVSSTSHSASVTPQDRGDVAARCPALKVTSVRFGSSGAMTFHYSKVSRTCARWLVDSGLSHPIRKGSTKFTTAALSFNTTHRIDILTARLKTTYRVYRSA